MANMIFKANLLPNSNLGYSLGSNDKQWTVYGSFKGNADTATALTSSAGSSTIPIYFSSGKPVQCSTTLGVSITGNAAIATKLSNTPNNTTTFLRGDNTWTNILMNDFHASGVVYSNGELVSNNANLIAHSTGGQIRLFSNVDGNRGIHLPAHGNGGAINPVEANTNNYITLQGNRCFFTDRGVIYSDPHSTGYGGLCLSGGNGYLSGASIALHACDDNSDQGPGNFYISARPTADTWDGQKVLEGRANGLLLWNGGLSVTGGANPGVGTYTGHTISTNGNIGCDYECYAYRGFYAGGASPVYRCYKTADNSWRDVLGMWGSGDGWIKMAGRLHIGWGETTDILIGPETNGYKLGCWGTYTTVIARNTGGAPWMGSAIEIREVSEVGNGSTAAYYSPKIGFHWGNVTCTTLGMEADAVIRCRWGDGTNNTTVGGLCTFQAGAVWGAVYNDYAEMRNVPEVQKLMKPKQPLKNYEKPKREIPMAGKCVREVGDDTMALSTKRLQKGCKIISDTFGFNIGETEDAKTPIAVCGRVLAYPYEDREEYRNHIGDFVCSGPDGTISIMTDEEALTQPWSIIGTISAVPDYERWGEDNVLVDGRIWIYVR